MDNAPETTLARVDRVALKKAAMNLKKVAPRKPDLPVLAHVQVRADGERLTLWATDLDVSLVLTLDGAEVCGDGVASCDAAELKQALTNVDADQVTLTASGNSPGLILEAGSVRLTFTGFDADEFPSRPEPSGEPDELEAGVEVWRALSDRVAPFVASDDSRAILQGVYLERDGDAFRAVASNGHRLMVAEYTDLSGEELEAIVPGAAFLKPLRLMMSRAGIEDDQYGRLRIFANFARIDLPGLTMWTRTIDGPFPNWRQVVPDPGDLGGRLTVDRETLAGAAETAADAATDANSRASLELVPGEPAALSVEGVEGPDLTAALEGSRYEGPAPMEVGFNAAYLAQIAGAHTADRLQVQVRAPERAALIRPVEADGWRTVLMPLRLY